MSYTFLVHRIFQQQADAFAEAFLEQKPFLWSSFVDQCRKACADPFKAGKPLERVAIDALKGRIYRLWIGGPKGHRFIYIVDHETQTVLPVFLSLEDRSRIDYDKLPWQEYAKDIYNDFVQGNTDAFKKWMVPI